MPVLKWVAVYVCEGSLLHTSELYLIFGIRYNDGVEKIINTKCIGKYSYSALNNDAIVTV